MSFRESFDQKKKKVEKQRDNYYFDSYSRMSIHRTMIADSVRTEGY